MAELEIHQFPCLSDNYGVLVHDSGSGLTASIDAPEAAAVEKALADTGWSLSHILTTHHHHDHTAGNAALKRQTGCTIVGPRAEASKVPGIDVQVGEGDSYELGSFAIKVLDTPGHTAGHISYWIPQAEVAFVGDTVFAIGCGRLLEGNARQMWDSLSKLMRLPAETRLYCGHEYTEANAQFALTVEPGNQRLVDRAEEVASLRARGEPTLPTTLARELETNPFLRPDSREVQKNVGMEGRELWEVFGGVRRAKDNA